MKIITSIILGCIASTIFVVLLGVSYLFLMWLVKITPVISFTVYVGTLVTIFSIGIHRMRS